jgi:hypothetical protein
MFNVKRHQIGLLTLQNELMENEAAYYNYLNAFNDVADRQAQLNQLDQQLGTTQDRAEYDALL